MHYYALWVCLQCIKWYQNIFFYLNRDDTAATLICCTLFTLIHCWQWASVIIIMMNSVRGYAYATSGTKPSSEEFVQFGDIPLGRQSPIDTSFRTQYTSFFTAAVWMIHKRLINKMTHKSACFLPSCRGSCRGVTAQTLSTTLSSWDRGGGHHCFCPHPKHSIISIVWRSMRLTDVWTQCAAKWATTSHVFHHYTQWLWIKLWEEKKKRV